MRRQQANQVNNQGKEEMDVSDVTIGQTLPAQARFLLFLIIVVSLLANTARSYDYNVVVGCGVYFLSTKNPLLYQTPTLYVLVILTICADGIVISLLYNKVSVFQAVVFPAIQIALKTILLIIEALYWRRQSLYEKEKEQQKLARNSHILRQIQEKKLRQSNRQKYLESKQQWKRNLGSYYLPRYGESPREENYKAQQYREFGRQQYVSQVDEKSGSKKK